MNNHENEEHEVVEGFRKVKRNEEHQVVESFNKTKNNYSTQSQHTCSSPSLNQSKDVQHNRPTNTTRNQGNYSNKGNNGNHSNQTPIRAIIGLFIVVIIIIVVVFRSCTSSKKSQQESPNSVITESSSAVYNDDDDEYSLVESTYDSTSNTEKVSISSSSFSNNDSAITGDNITTIKEIKIEPLDQNSISVDPITQKETTIEKAIIETIAGTISSEGQTDTYTFVPPVTGRYRFEISELTKGTGNKVNIRIKNSGDGVEGSTNYGVGNGDGVTIKDMQANEQYTIEIRQYSGLDNYNLNIGYQKETVDVTDVTEVHDSIEYTDQRNVYTFIPSVTGRYRFEIDGLTKGSGNKVNILVFNSGGGDEGSTQYGVGNGDGVTVKDMQAKEKYEIQVRQYSGIDEYTLKIGKQKETIDVSDVTEIHDSIEYTDQRNVYTFIPAVSGRYRFEITDLAKGSGNKVNVLVFNSGGGDEGSTQYGCGNGDGVTIKDMQAEEKYEIQIRQYSGTDEYTLKIGKQKEEVDISNYSIIKDSIEFTDQRNVYYFTPSRKSNYRFNISGLSNGSGNKVNILVFNSRNGDEGSTQYGVGNDDGITVKDMDPNELYQVQVRYYSGFDEYTLSIGETRDE